MEISDNAVRAMFEVWWDHQPLDKRVCSQDKEWAFLTYLGGFRDRERIPNAPNGNSDKVP